MKMTIKMIKTDWLAIKIYHWRLIVMAATIVLLAAVGLSMAIIPIAAYMAVSFSVNTFAVEEKGKLDSLYLTLPLSRKDIVRGRFVFMGAALLTGLSVSGVAITISLPNMQLGDLYMGVTPSAIALMCSLGFAGGGFISLCMYPALFRLGYEKGKIWGFYLPIGITVALFELISILSNTETFMPKVLGWLRYWSEHTLIICAVTLAIGAALMYVSYRLSLWQYNKRDL